MIICCCSMFGSVVLFGFIENFNLISPLQPFTSVLPSNTNCISQTLNHNKTFVCIRANVQPTGCSRMPSRDWTLCVNGRSLKLRGIYEVSFDTNEPLINNIISKTGCLLGRDSCKTGLPECGRGQASGGGRQRTNGELMLRVCMCDPAPVHSCHSGPDVALHSCREL